MEFALADLTPERAEFFPQHLAEQLRARALEQLLGFPVQVGEAPFAVEGIEGVGDRLERDRQPLGDARRLLCGLAAGLAGHVLDCAQVARAAAFFAQQLGAHAHVARVARPQHDPVPEVEPRAGVQRRVHRVAHLPPLVRVHAPQDVPEAGAGRPEAADGARPVRQAQGHVGQVHFPASKLACGRAAGRQIIGERVWWHGRSRIDGMPAL
jgi:hypothetical protein